MAKTEAQGYTAAELSIINQALTVDRVGQKPKLFNTLLDQTCAGSVFEEIHSHTDEKKEKFLDCELSFSTEQKAFLLKLLKPEVFPTVAQEVKAMQELTVKLS